MKILFVSPEIEEKGRGITGIIKAMIAAAKADGHEVGLLVGYPALGDGKSETLDTKLEHIHLQHYMLSGKDSFLNHYPGGIKRRRNLAKILSGRTYLKHTEFHVRQDYLSSDDGILKNLDFCVKVPFAYQFFNHGMEKIPRAVLKKAAKQYGVDLVVTGSPMLLTTSDVRPAKIAQFVHDVMPLELMETPADNNTPQKFAKQMYAASWESDLVLVNSKDTADKVYEINADANVEILYGIASSGGKRVHESAILEHMSLSKDKFITFISVIEKRKNVVNLMEAYSKIHKDIDMPLVIVGGEGFGYKDIRKHHNNMPKEVREKIHFTGFVSEADKYTLLRNSRAFVFPSIYEGIGLPIIEAFYSGIPVLTSRRGALPEAGGDAALYIENPYDTSEIAEKIVQICQNNKLRKELSSHIDEQKEKFTVEKFNERFSQGIKKLK